MTRPSSTWLNERSADGLAILDPLLDEDLLALGRAAGVAVDTRVADVGCGTGELLVRWAGVFGTRGEGVDASPAFVARASERALAAGLDGRVAFEAGDGAQWVAGRARRGAFDVAVCLGAAWIGGGFSGTASLLVSLVGAGGVVVIGDEHWAAPPSPVARAAIGGPAPDTDVEANVAALERLGLHVRHVLEARREGWDAYELGRARALERWLTANPDAPEAPAVEARRSGILETYERWGRACLGWAAYVAVLA